MSSERNTTIHPRPAPVAIPAICYLSGIFVQHTLHHLAVLPPFFYAHFQAIHFGALSLCASVFFCFWLLPHFSTLSYPRTCYGLALLTIFFTGVWCYANQNNLSTLPKEGTPAVFCGMVESISPTKSQKYMRIGCRILAYRQFEASVQCNYKTFIYIPIDKYHSSLQQGSTLLTLSKISQTPDSLPFSMPPSLFITRYSPLFFSHIQPSFPVRWGRQLLQHLKTNVRNPNAYALIAGLSLGNKEAFDPELKSAYAAAGASHVLAVSGLHVGIIYGIIVSFFDLFLPGNSRRKQILKQLLIVCALTIFAALAGFTPSVTRALLMVSLSIMGKLILRQVNSIQTLFATALLICLFNPAALFEIGFQLSFCAVLAILWIQPPLQNLWHPKTKAIKYLWALMTTSTAAQAGTAPIAFIYFGTFPYLFLITNLLVIPLTGIILYLLCIWLVVGQIPYIGHIVLWAMEQCAIFMNQGVLWIDRLI
jgi:competence protein ComEC